MGQPPRIMAKGAESRIVWVLALTAWGTCQALCMCVLIILMGCRNGRKRIVVRPHPIAQVLTSPLLLPSTPSSHTLWQENYIYTLKGKQKYKMSLSTICQLELKLQITPAFQVQKGAEEALTKSTQSAPFDTQYCRQGIAWNQDLGQCSLDLGQIEKIK